MDPRIICAHPNCITCIIGPGLKCCNMSGKPSRRSIP